MANQTEEICGGELVPINGATQAKRNLQVGKVDPDPASSLTAIHNQLRHSTPRSQ